MNRGDIINFRTTWFTLFGLFILEIRIEKTYHVVTQKDEWYQLKYCRKVLLSLASKKEKVDKMFKEMSGIRRQ